MKEPVQTVPRSRSATIELGKRHSCCSKPVWLLSTLADLDQKIRTLVLVSDNDKNQDQSDTFAKRAESYYQQRPKLLSLLLDLYNNYLTLADRYCISVHSRHRHHSIDNRHGPTYSSEDLSGDAESSISYQSDAESSISYQLPNPSVPARHQNNNLSEEIVTELVIKNVEYDLMVNELGLKEKQPLESSRKIELQRSLLEVLESERMILLNENAGLRYKVNALIEENKGLASESMFMKRKAGELARCVLSMRNDHRACMLSRKIEDLQGKIYGLEKRNQEYYQKLMTRKKGKCASCEEISLSTNDITVNKEDKGVSAETCFQETKEKNVVKNGKKISRWWKKVTSFDILFLCKPNASKSSVGC